MISTTKTIQVQVEFRPEILKMGLKGNVAVSQPAELEAFKAQVLDLFWAQFPGKYEGKTGKVMNIGRHGSVKGVIVEDLNCKKINSTEELRAHTENINGVYVRFSKNSNE
ncbi:MAG: hypothetical protein V4489_09875 [Chlamydiota bacterium]